MYYALIALLSLLTGMIFARRKEVFSLFLEEPGGKMSSGRVLCFSIIFHSLYKGGEIHPYLAGCAVLFYFATRVDKRLIQAVIMRFLDIKGDIRPGA